jgi:hypothetical protein
MAREAVSRCLTSVPFHFFSIRCKTDAVPFKISSRSVGERMLFRFFFFLFRLSAHAGAMMIELVSHQKAAGTLALIQYL